MRWLAHQDNRGRVVLITATLFMWLLILFSFKYYGYEETWRIWNVPTQMPPFLDFRLIPGSAESFQRGFEPTITNPGDPADRIFNYPAFWRIFFYSGITQDDTIWISIVMIVMFFICVFLFTDQLRSSDAIVMIFLIFSPAAMLLYERGNVDLIVFCLCVMIVLSTDYSPYITSALLVFAAVVKLYPFFGFTVLFKESKSKFSRLCLRGVEILLVYLYLTLKSVKASWSQTMRGDEISYGTNVLFQRYSPSISELLGVSQTGRILMLMPIVLTLVLIMVAGVAGASHREPLPASSSRNLAAFRMGASIYVGTFLLGNNWDYRLAFLILVIPQVLQWSKYTDKHYGYTARAVLVLVLISCWHFVVWFAPSLTSVKEYIFIVDELANWMLIAGLGYLFLASAPDWLKIETRGVFGRRRRKLI